MSPPGWGPGKAIDQWSMSEIVEGLDGGQRERIASLRSDGRYFEIYVCTEGLTPELLGEALDIPPHALEPLLDFQRGGLASRRFHADGQHVIFPFTAYLEASRPEGADGPRLAAIDLNG